MIGKMNVVLVLELVVLFPMMRMMLTFLSSYFVFSPFSFWLAGLLPVGLYIEWRME